VSGRSLRSEPTVVMRNEVSFRRGCTKGCYQSSILTR
jgi:hypothetical protein